MYFALILFFLIAFLLSVKYKINITPKAILLIAIGVRLMFTFFFVNASSEDLRFFLVDGRHILNKNMSYPFLYFPFYPYLAAASVLVKSFLNPFLFLKLIFGVFDIGVTYMVYLLSKKNSNSMLLYAINPVSLIISNIHGQFDAIPLFFLLWAAYLSIKKKNILSVIALSAGVWIKTWPFLFSLPFLKRLKDKREFFLIGIFPLLFTLTHVVFFRINIIDILTPIKNYRGVYGFWGIGAMISFLPILSLFLMKIVRRVFLLSFLIFSIFIKRKNIIDEILILLLFFFSFTVTFGSQWLIWLLPFIIIKKPKYWLWFIISSTVYLMVNFMLDVYQNLYMHKELYQFYSTVLGFFCWIFVFRIYRSTVKRFDKI